MDTSVVTNTSSVDKVNREISEKVAEENAKTWGFPYINLEEFPINADFIRFLSEAEAREAGMIVFDKKGKVLHIAVDKPANEQAKKISEKLKADGFTLEFFVCSSDALNKALGIYQSNLVQKKSVKISHHIDEDKNSLESNLDKFTELEAKLLTAPVATTLNEIYLLSVASRASDIHFQPSDKGLSLRLRVNGVLHRVLEIPFGVAEKMIPQIKYDGGMKSNITESPQDGRIEFSVNERIIELRVSTLPMDPIESVVMRVLDSRRGIKSFSDLGFESHIEEKILRVLQQKNGIILVTGPTGSGKTTTLYSMLAELNTQDRKLVTLEDPIEYHLEGVSQSQVNEAQEYNFETGFKSLLRHDPDVILVGEVRTIPTAKLAFEAALTGHTVLSSLHTNNAVGAVSRLRNMGMENYNISPTINAVFAQKLIRELDPSTPVKDEFVAELAKKNPRIFAALERIKKVLPNFQIPEKMPTETAEKNAFFAGQTVICEAFLLDDGIREMILQNQSEMNIKNYLLEKTDFLSMFESGLLKVLQRKTTLAEILRVVGV